MSDVTVSVVESTTSVTVSNDVVDVSIVESPVTISTGNSGPQGASYNQGDPIYERIRNSTGSTLLKGQIVYLSGATGNHVNVSLALASGDATSARTIGWISENIANNAEGFVMMFGYLEGIDTSAASAVGDILYLSPTVPGGWTSTKPSAPQHMVYVGVCVRKNPSNGAVSVHIQNGYELGELHDVAISSPVNNQVLTYDSATDLWVNATNPADGVTSITATAPLTGGTITSIGSIGLDQTALSIAQSQVSGLVSDLAGKANLAGGNALTGAQTITSTAIGEFPLSIIPASGQTASTFRVRNSANNADLMSIDSSGQIRTTTILNPNSFNNSRLQMQNTGVFIDTGVTTNVPLAVRGSSGQTADLLKIQSNAGTDLLAVNSSGSLLFGTGSGSFLSGANGRVNVQLSGDNIGVTVRAFGSQTADLLQFQTSAGSYAGGFERAGALNIQPAAALNGYSLMARAASASVVPVMVRGAASQSADLLQLQNSAGSNQLSVSPSGILSSNGAYLSQVFAGSGISGGTLGRLNVASFSAGQVAQVIRGVASQVEDAIEIQDSAGTVLGGRNANAQIFTGSTAPLTTAVGGGTSGASGTGSVATISTVNAHNLANGDRVTIAGMTPTGYNGTYIVSGVSTFSFNIANATTGAQTVAGTVSVDAQASVTSRSAATTPLILRGAASQSSNLFEVQRADAGVAFRVRNNGNFGSGGLVTGTNAYINNDIIGNTTGLIIRGASGQSNDLQQWQENNTGVPSSVTAFGGFRVRTFGASYSDTSLAVQAGYATEVPVRVRGAASQSVNLQEWQSSAGVILARVESTGAAMFGNGNMSVSSVGSIFANTVNTNVGRIGMSEANSGGQLTVTRQTAAATNPGANIARLYFRDGTNAGTLKLVVRAGAAGAETTILDNIPQ